MNENGNGTRVPYNELDLNFMITEPAWGRECPDELYQAVSKITSEAYEDANGVLVVDKEPLWGLLSYYTRDLRLGNLSGMSGELKYCQYWLDFAGDLLREDYIQSFLSALARVITLLELSQSKNGFLRRRQGTITSERISKDSNEPNKKGWLGGKRQEQ